MLVYDVTGKLVAEYGSAPAEANGTQYVTADHQGSPRAITNSAGSVVSRHDYAPFGEDLPANIGLRTTGQGYSQPDAVRQKYAGMENDDATGMSHTLWRQYDSLSARWTAPDPYGGSMEIDDPQTFNRYSYVGNDPVNETDPLGLMAGADQSWGSVAGDFWGSSAGFNRPNFGGPETIGASLMLNQSRMNNWLSRLRRGGEAGLGGENVIVTNIFAFQSRQDAIRYYEREYGGPVAEVNGRFGLGPGLVRIPYSQRFINAVTRILPRKAGRTIGAQALFASGDQLAGGTVNAFVLHDFASNSDVLGVSYGGGTHSAERGHWGYMATAGIGDGYLITNARDDELDGDSQAIIAGAGIFGVEIDLSRGKDGAIVYSVNVTGGKSVGAGLITMPVRTKTTGDIKRRILRQ